MRTVVKQTRVLSTFLTTEAVLVLPLVTKASTTGNGQGSKTQARPGIPTTDSRSTAHLQAYLATVRSSGPLVYIP